MPITASMQRSALRPLLAASAASIAHSKESNIAASLDATQTGHWVALLDLASASLAAMSTQHSRAAEALVATACEELQAQVSGMTTRHVASSVLLLGEILTKQVCALQACIASLVSQFVSPNPGSTPSANQLRVVHCSLLLGY